MPFGCKLHKSDSNLTQKREFITSCNWNALGWPGSGHLWVHTLRWRLPPVSFFHGTGFDSPRLPWPQQFIVQVKSRPSVPHALTCHIPLGAAGISSTWKAWPASLNPGPSCRQLAGRHGGGSAGVSTGWARRGAPPWGTRSAADRIRASTTGLSWSMCVVPEESGGFLSFSSCCLKA